MSWKTILVHADTARQAPQRLRFAVDLAARQDAHLIGLAATGLPRHVYGNGIASLEDMVLLNQLDELRGDAQTALGLFEEAARASQLASWEPLLIDDEAAAGLARLIPYADLVVMGQPDPDDKNADMARMLPEHVLLDAGRPVLFLPYVGDYSALVRIPLIAWDGSAGASRAVSGALPLLQQAGAAKVVVFNALRHGDVDADRAGPDLARYLSRHGVRCDVLRESTEQDVGSALLALAADVFADLLVMGGYGHSRLRGMLVGSASRTVLRAMTLPVLMAH
jgi:nucleotide-binding universal stress UspA family protein